MNIISIDIGYHNMGLVEAFIDEEFEIHIKGVHKINLTKIPHKKVKPCDCCLYHTNELADHFAHFVQEYGHLLDDADRILIERQPPMGLTSVESLILYTYRRKTHLVSPNSMHSHFKIGHLEYERRKEKTIEIACPLLEVFENYQSLDRKHDIADAVCMIIFDNHDKKEKHRLRNIDRSLPFDRYRYENPIRRPSGNYGHGHE